MVISRTFYMCFDDVDSFKEVSRLIQGNFEVASRKFQGSYKGVLGIFQDLKGYSRKFECFFKQV